MSHRYLPVGEEDRAALLKGAGADNLEDLFAGIPESLRLKDPLPMAGGLCELSAARRIKELAVKNHTISQSPSFLGAGIYDRFIPAAVGRIASISQFYTAYTPYQPEISQGTLSVIFEFQTLIAELTGLFMANASMYDGATAAAEAMLIACRQTRRNKILLPVSVHPQVRAVLKTYARFSDLIIVEVPLSNGQTDAAAVEKLLDDTVAGLFIQTPNFFGIPEDAAAFAGVVHSKKALLIGYNTNPQMMAVLTSFGEAGCDIACGEAQGLGLDPYLGGNCLGFMAVTEKLMRRIPGRVVGQSLDSEGRRAFVLTLQAREQHIRRESATSNICTNQALNALKATVYMTLTGPEGMRDVVMQSVSKASWMKRELDKAGFSDAFPGAPTLDEFVITLPETAASANVRLKQAGIIGGYDLASLGGASGLSGEKSAMLISVTEKRTVQEMEDFIACLSEVER